MGWDNRLVGELNAGNHLSGDV